MENLRERQGAGEPVEVAHLGSHVHCPRCARRAHVLNRPCRAWPPPGLTGGVMDTTAHSGLAHCEHCDRPFFWSCRSLMGPGNTEQNSCGPADDRDPFMLTPGRGRSSGGDAFVVELNESSWRG